MGGATGHRSRSSQVERPPRVLLQPLSKPLRLPATGGHLFTAVRVRRDALPASVTNSATKLSACLPANLGESAVNHGESRLVWAHVGSLRRLPRRTGGGRAPLGRIRVAVQCRVDECALLPRDRLLLAAHPSRRKILRQLLSAAVLGANERDVHLFTPLSVKRRRSHLESGRGKTCTLSVRLGEDCVEEDGAMRNTSTSSTQSR